MRQDPLRAGSRDEAEGFSLDRLCNKSIELMVQQRQDADKDEFMAALQELRFARVTKDDFDTFAT